MRRKTPGSRGLARRILCVALSASMALSGVPVAALADEGAEPTAAEDVTTDVSADVPEDEDAYVVVDDGQGGAPADGEVPDDGQPLDAEGEGAPAVEPGDADVQEASGPAQDEQPPAEPEEGEPAADEPVDTDEAAVPVDEAKAVVSAPSNAIASGTWGTCPWEIDADGKLTVRPGEGGQSVSDASSPYYSYWYDYRDSITSVVFLQEGDSKVVAPEDCSYLLCGLEKVVSVDASGLDVSAVTNMSNMFSSLDSPDPSSRRSSLVSVDTSGWDTSSVTSMSSMFYGCSSLESLDVSGWETSSVTSMSSMFYGCSSLESLDVSGWETSSVTSMSSMFSGCSSLEALDLFEWNTSSVANMGSMFYGCSSLSSLGVSGWDVSSVGYTGFMFSGCSYLSSLDLSGWETSSVTSMVYMFDGCSSLSSLGVSGWDTSNVASTNFMFRGCSSLSSLDLSGWETPSLIGTRSMFEGASSLATIVVGDGWTTSSVDRSDDMFLGCTSLVGGNGTAYDGSHVDAGYARVDLPGAPGYLTGDVVDISGATVSAIAAQTYTGSALKPRPTVKYGSKTLRLNTDYTLSYKNNVNVGTATVTVTGKGGYTGTKSVTFKIKGAPISKATVSAIAAQAYTGKAYTPKPTVKYGSKTLRLGTDYTLAYKNNTKAGTATVTITGKGNYAGTKAVTFRIVAPSVSYRTHVQNVGWQSYVKDGAMSGTSGRALRLEGINIKLASKPVTGGITYRTHVQNIGWQGWRSDGAMSGTSGKALRLEAIQIKLTGEMAKRYDVYYRVHCQNIGWMGWAKNGQQSGSAGYAYRLEGIQIVIVPKGAKAPASTYRGITANTSQAFREKPKSSPASSGSSSSSSTSSERVLITRTGSKYHRLSGCRSTASAATTEISISEARARGYEPCKNCYH